MTSASDDTRPPGAGEEPSVAGVAWRLALYVLPGAAAAMVVWEVLSTLLMGRLPERGLAWLATALLVVLAGAVAALRSHVSSRR